MSLLLALAILVVSIAVLATAVIAVVRRDGYGTTEPPRSHPLEEALPGRPGRRL
jgi:hypothetical protein